MERAKLGKLRDEVLREEAERVAAHRAAVVAAQQVNNVAMVNNSNSDGCSGAMSSYPPLYPAPSTPQHRYTGPGDVQRMQQLRHQFSTSAPPTATTFLQNPLENAMPPPMQSPPLAPSQTAQQQQMQQPVSMLAKQQVRLTLIVEISGFCKSGFGQCPKE